MIKYKIMATSLDAFQRYLGSEEDTAFQEMIDRINRVPFESEKADKGTAFNNIVDLAIKNPNFLKLHIDNKLEEMQYQFKNWEFSFKVSVIKEFADYFKDAVSQVYTEGIIETQYGEVLMYGYIDELQGTCYDIKTTGSYTFPKYLHAWQHVVYLYCLNKSGFPVTEFEYTVTDFKNTYRETYNYEPEKDIIKLRSFVEQYIEFLELNKELITDKKIFALT